MAVDKKLVVALAGNPNSGKSTLFNNLTGSRQHVGNYPGVTVEKKEGRRVYQDYRITFIDLPGTYGLAGYSEDEVVARDFLIHDKPDVIVHIVDASNLERNLYLYTQLAELNIPIVLVMNMSDVVEQKGRSIDYVELSRLLGRPVVVAIGNKNKGTDDLLEAIIRIHKDQDRSSDVAIDYGDEIRQEYDKIYALLKDSQNDFDGYPLKLLAIKLLENDADVPKMLERFPQGPAILLQAQKSRNHLRQHFGDDPEVAIAERRYGFISGACMQVVRTTVEERHDLSDKVDRIVLNRFLGLPIFAFVMYAIFRFTFTFSEPVIRFLEVFFAWVASTAASFIPDPLVQSLVVDGVIKGVGGVLGFFPLVLFMFFAIAFFEDSGYMARAAFVMDKIMHQFGLHGKSFLPLMISTNGCAVPGIMASRTLDSKRDRLITMMVTPFMICGAKLPIFALFIGAFFPADQGADIMFLMYVLSIILAFGSAWVLKKIVFKGETAHFVMELPPYRIPTLQGLLLKMWERGWMYVKKAGTIILLISVIIWAGFSFPRIAVDGGIGQTHAASLQMEQSFAGRLGKFIEPAVRPIGMDWRGGVALMSGVAAKEVVVSTLGTIYSLGEVDLDETDSLQDALLRDPWWNPLKAMAFLIFCLIYMPCFVTVAVFYKESGSSWKWTLFLVSWTTAMAWGASFLVYQVGMMLGFGG